MNITTSIQEIDKTYVHFEKMHTFQIVMTTKMDSEKTIQVHFELDGRPQSVQKRNGRCQFYYMNYIP